MSFAETFEQAYQHNLFLAEKFVPGIDEMTMTTDVPEWSITERGGGFVVAVRGTQRVGDAHQPPSQTGTPAPAGLLRFRAWYYLADRTALRDATEQLERDDPPTFEYPMTIVCR